MNAPTEAEMKQAIDALRTRLFDETRAHLGPQAVVSETYGFLIGLLMREIALLQLAMEKKS